MRKQLLKKQFLLVLLTMLIAIPQGVWAENYGLTVAGVQVTDANASGISGDNITGTVSYTHSAADNSGILTLSGATLTGNIEVNGISALTIKVAGQNVINAGSVSALKSNVGTNAVTLAFAKEGSGNCSLTLNSTEVTVISTGFSTPTYTDLALVVDGVEYPDYYSLYGLAYYAGNDVYSPITSATITSYETYGIIVSGETVTNLNKDNICKGTVGSGHILFDGEHTLTFNNVPDMVFNGEYPFIQTSMDLTINLVGTSYFDCGNSVFITRMGDDMQTYTVTFTTDEDNPGMLTLQVGDQFDGFDKAFENGLSWNPDGYSDPNGPVAWVAQPVASYNLTVGGTAVTSANAPNVLGESAEGQPTVVFDASTSTLTLNGATIEGDIVYTPNDDTPLWINIYGTNSVNGISCNSANNISLYVSPAETNAVTHSLTVTGNGTDAAISGFYNIDEVNNEYYDIELRLYWKPTITNNVMTSLIITSNIFGGTGTESSPYIISTPTQLETFATLYNASELASDCYVELGDDIDCRGLQGFEPIGTPEMPFIGHFDGASHKISYLLYEAGSEYDYAGLFRKVGDDGDEPAPGYVLNLTLENCTFRNGNMYNGAIAGLLNKGTIDNCTVTSCNILSETSQPSSGGIVGGLFGGSITNCTVSGSTITVTSAAGSIAGGIVAYAYGSDNGSVTVSGCQVTGTATNPTTITGSSNYGGDQGDNPTGGVVGYCGYEYSIVISNNKVSGNTTISSIDYYDDTNNYTCAGAIVGDKGNASFSNNYYYYTVTTSTKNGEAEVVERSGYQQRGTGFAPYNEQLQQETEDYDIVPDNGAMLYTKLVTFNIDTHCGMETDFGYELLSEPDNRKYYFAPGQSVAVTLNPDNGYSIEAEAVTLTYTKSGAAEATVETLVNSATPEDVADYIYQFTVPDANASFDVTVNQALDIEFVDDNSWASYYATEDLAVPEGLTAYVVSSVNEETGAVTVASIDYIPANNGVLLQRAANGAASGYTAGEYTGNTTQVTNLLAGSQEATDISSIQNQPVYVLFNDKFKRATSGTIPARRAYLPLGAAVVPSGAPQFMNINIGDGSVTAIKTLSVDDKNDSWYTIDGLKLNGKPQRKGIYINNGKKKYINNNK